MVSGSGGFYLWNKLKVKNLIGLFLNRGPSFLEQNLAQTNLICWFVEPENWAGTGQPAGGLGGGGGVDPRVHTHPLPPGGSQQKVNFSLEAAFSFPLKSSNLLWCTVLHSTYILYIVTPLHKLIIYLDRKMRGWQRVCCDIWTYSSPPYSYIHSMTI